MTREHEKQLWTLPLFDPLQGTVVLSPESEGEGYWVGAPTIVFDESRESFLLCYRRRRPRGYDSDRGYVSVVAESKDGLAFESLWSVTKEELETTSIEKCSILHCDDGVYRHYLSYVDPADDRWRVDVLESSSPETLDVTKRKPVFTAASASEAHDAPVEGVKDPNVYRIGALYVMLLSYAEGAPASTGDASRLHATSDVYNTGLLTAPSAIATSADGLTFTWKGRCLDVGAAGSWDSYQARLGSLLHHGGVWYGFYDGSASHAENYEERFGLAQSFDLESWIKSSVVAPLITVPHGTGSVRYTDVIRIGDELFYYYEVVRPDGSHELRRSVVTV